MTKISDELDGTLYFVPWANTPVQSFAIVEPLSLYRLLPGLSQPEYYHEDIWERSSVFPERRFLGLEHFAVYDNLPAATAAAASLIVDTSTVPHMWRRKELA